MKRIRFCFGCVSLAVALLATGCPGVGNSNPQDQNGNGGSGNNNGGSGNNNGGSGNNNGGSGGPGANAGEVVAPATNAWRTAKDTNGNFVFVDPKGQKRVLRGISTTGMETGSYGTASGGGFWIYDPGNEQDPVPLIQNVVNAMEKTWKTSVVRVPICGSAWAKPYIIHTWSNRDLMDYRKWVDNQIQAIRKLGNVAIIDLHLWQIAPLSSEGSFPRKDDSGNPFKGRVDGCIGYQKDEWNNYRHSCASTDWDMPDARTWTCPVANAEGVTLQNAYYNRKKIAAMWADIAEKYKGDSGVFFEIMNEPYEQVDNGAKFESKELAEGKVFPEEKDYNWPMWTEVMNTAIKAIRGVGAKNVIIVNGLMWGYTFGPGFGPIGNPDKYLPWIKDGVENIAYGFHPYQHGTCCGEVGETEDKSKDDPFQLGYCRYRATEGQPSGKMLPSSKVCGHVGYELTRPMGMPPCKWVAKAYNPKTKKGDGLCVGQPDVCEPLTQEQCDKIDRGSPEAGGWSRYVLPMRKFGPLIATEFGSFDCSSPFVAELMDYAGKYDISYTAWALWPQNNGGTLNLGVCSYPGITEEFPKLNGNYPPDFKGCRDSAQCEQAMAKPMRWAGKVVFDDLGKHAAERYLGK